jgi:hypothetical protein
MANATLLPCDGCGQLATDVHISHRLQRLEWATRFRPIHIQTLLLGGISSQRDDEFLYSPQTPIAGEARTILQAVQISTEAKSKEAILAEFQKLGLMLAHVLECPLETPTCGAESHMLIQNHLPAAVTRIRRSLKPKRVLLLSGHLQRLAGQMHQMDLGCPVFPSPTGTYLQSANPAETELEAFRSALAGSYA